MNVNPRARDTDHRLSFVFLLNFVCLWFFYLLYDIFSSFCPHSAATQLFPFENPKSIQRDYSLFALAKETRCQLKE